MYSSYQEIRKALQKKEVRVKEIVEYYLRKIEETKHLNAYLEVYAEEALSRADEIDKKLQAGKAGNLAGMVITHKDVICYENHRLQASSKILDGFVAQFTAPSLQRMLDADVIVIGRVNCDEFAMGGSNENSAFGVVRNNIDPTRVPGGSSGGSAVSVSADTCLISLGSDTGGSVRQPAAFTGIVGFKPTYSRISRYGLIAYASSFDTIGVLAKNVEDTALVMEYLAGKDEYDATVSQKPVPPYSQLLEIPTHQLKIGYIKEVLETEAVQKEIKEAVWRKIEQFRADGHEVIPVDFPLYEYALPTYYILTTAEASTNLSRYDGVRYGYRSPNAVDVETLYKRTRSEGFGPEVKRRIMLGTFVLSASYYDAYFTKAQKVRRIIRDEMLKLLNNLDFLITPTTPTTAFEIGKYNEENVLELYYADILTVTPSLCGLPAISIPIGLDEKNLPIGLQVTAKYFEEASLLAFAKYAMQN
ncbi:MAG: Asp-tRNA(Asn)/Glu-tRNA(Gln) amidotransferase subunit GatA [Cytophagales bacterium]|nr:Asp-tRNA(Asn)/Glu-tRNA(Gln) amidotransferase subunit GatA [Cytophagales bacterium]MDW8385220.1 Asp-tRNA(Asn)/Glu-tRNA(Gln) amidotransferase subunit GatA [Flammeovirgaceae bacterium]